MGGKQKLPKAVESFVTIDLTLHTLRHNSLIRKVIEERPDLCEL